MNSFQLKADFLPITILRLLRHEPDLLQSQLNTLTQKAPNYFSNSPVIIDFSALKETSDEMDVLALCETLRRYQMQPIAARGLKTQSDLPNLADIAQKSAPVKNTAPETIKAATKIITKPVRAGTQIYAKDGDLIILAPVNAGAEIIADGHIHIYAPLRGRALAGASGDTSARIFCNQLEAELVAIAGHYLVSEKLKAHKIAQNRVQIYLLNEELQIESI
ncbi:MAG: septum site-determining protein MinC [Gammaproteobacteria bacterium]|nr:septum site-determining protein MinC [Gammaproteobacteria bacterium]